MSMPNLSERQVYYEVATEGGGYYHAAWPSSEINRIQNADLRLALQLADIVQALGVLEPPLHGGYPGNVRAISSPRVGGRQPSAAVYTSFPDDIFERLQQYHEQESMIMREPKRDE